MVLDITIIAINRNKVKVFELGFKCLFKSFILTTPYLLYFTIAFAIAFAVIYDGKIIIAYIYIYQAFFKSFVKKFC